MALLTTYKMDMATTLEHMARIEALSTSYSENNDDNRMKNNKAVRKSHAKRNLQNEDDEEAPDKQKKKIFNRVI